MTVYQERRVVARKAHRCTSCDRPSIKAGDVYRGGVLFSNGEFGPRGPLSIKECAFCAERYGRDWMLHPLPPEQNHEVYLNAMRSGRG